MTERGAGRLLSEGKSLIRQYGTYSIARSAAALAFFLVLSFFPLLLCLSFFVGLFRVDVQQLLSSLQQVLPGAALELAADYVEYVSRNRTPGLLLAGLLAILLSASAGLRVLLDTMDELYHHPRRSGLRRMLMSVLLSLLFLLTVYLSLAVILTGDWFLHLLEGVVPHALQAKIDFSAFAFVWRWLRYLLLFCFVILLVSGLYVVGIPRGAASSGSVLAGALLSALALVSSSALFSRFIGLSSRYSLVYGSLASLMILLAWLYLCGNILLLGALLHRNWNQRKKEK